MSNPLGELRGLGAGCSKKLLTPSGAPPKSAPVPMTSRPPKDAEDFPAHAGAVPSFRRSVVPSFLLRAELIFPFLQGRSSFPANFFSMATPPGNRATPLGNQATPLRNRATPPRNQATPSLSRATPLLSQATALLSPATASLTLAKSPLCPVFRLLDGKLSDFRQKTPKHNQKHKK
jgi:hypothetical protein